MSESMSLDNEAGAGLERPTDSGMSRLTLIDGPAIARLMSWSCNWWTSVRTLSICSCYKISENQRKSVCKAWNMLITLARCPRWRLFKDSVCTSTIIPLTSSIWWKDERASLSLFCRSSTFLFWYSRFSISLPFSPNSWYKAAQNRSINSTEYRNQKTFFSLVPSTKTSN